MRKRGEKEERRRRGEGGEGEEGREKRRDSISPFLCTGRLELFVLRLIF